MDILTNLNIFFAPLPDRQIGNRIVKRFLCRPEDKKRIKKAFTAEKYISVPYLTFTKENGYIYLYPMVAPDFFVGKDGIEILYQLSVNAYAMDKAAIPLDKSINEGIFERSVRNKDGQGYILSESDMLCYAIAYSIFDFKGFSKDSIEYILYNKKYLSDDNTRHKLENIFFEFTPILSELIAKEEFERILKDYNSFSEY